MSWRIPPVYLWAPIPTGRLDQLIGVRHAFPGALGDYGEGDEAITLCGRTLRYAEKGSWLRYPSCMDCWREAKHLIERAVIERRG